MKRAKYRHPRDAEVVALAGIPAPVLAPLNVLLLGMALTTVWMIHLGDWLTHTGRRQELTPLDKADYGLFRLGRDYVQRCRTLEQPVPVGFTVRHKA